MSASGREIGHLGLCSASVRPRYCGACEDASTPFSDPDAGALDLVRRPKLFRFKETVSQFETVCLDAIPVVGLVTFLIGVVFAYLLGVQAQRYGANIFVVDGVGLAVCRELSPLLWPVIVAGRSGAAFTAQIGTMKVQEEIDAISTLGLSPIQVLVIPRLVAIMIALPLLVFVGDLAGIAGGMLVSAWQLDISAADFSRPPSRRAADERAHRRPGQGAGVCRLHRADRLPHGHAGRARCAQRRREHHIDGRAEHRMGDHAGCRVCRRVSAPGDLNGYTPHGLEGGLDRHPVRAEVIHDGVSFTVRAGRGRRTHRRQRHGKVGAC